jgi:hypothetical protein
VRDEFILVALQLLESHQRPTRAGVLLDVEEAEAQGTSLRRCRLKVEAHVNVDCWVVTETGARRARLAERGRRRDLGRAVELVLGSQVAGVRVAAERLVVCGGWEHVVPRAADRELLAAAHGKAAARALEGLDQLQAAVVVVVRDQ